MGKLREQCERSKGFEKMEGGGVKSRLARFLFRYRTTPLLTTGAPPAEMLMRHLRTKLDLLRPSVTERVYKQQSKKKATHDHHAKERDIQVDDNVYVREFRTNKAWLPGEVIEETGPVSTQVALEDGQVVRRHQDHVRAKEVKEAEPVATLMSATTVSTQDLPEVTPLVNEYCESTMPQTTRPTRMCKPPAYLKDYEQQFSYRTNYEGRNEIE